MPRERNVKGKELQEITESTALTTRRSGVVPIGSPFSLLDKFPSLSKLPSPCLPGLYWYVFFVSGVETTNKLATFQAFRLETTFESAWICLNGTGCRADCCVGEGRGSGERNPWGTEGGTGIVSFDEYGHVLPKWAGVYVPNFLCWLQHGSTHSPKIPGAWWK